MPVGASGQAGGPWGGLEVGCSHAWSDPAKWGGGSDVTHAGANAGERELHVWVDWRRAGTANRGGLTQPQRCDQPALS